MRPISKAGAYTDRGLMEEPGCRVPISVDGGVNEETGRALTDAGADVLIAGSYIFRGGNIEDHVQALKRL